MTRIAGKCLVYLLVAVLAVLCAPGRPGTASEAGSKESEDMSAFLIALGKKVSDFTTLKAEFVQEKEMALFKDKLVMKGRLYLRKPDRIAWHVDSPVRYSILVTDKLIRQWDEDTDKVQELSLGKNPVFQNILNQLTVWFSGDYNSLLAGNDIRRINSDPLEIEFSPNEKNAVKKVVKNITITFREDQKYLKQIRIREVGGDVTTIHFNNTLLNVPLENAAFEVKPVRARSSQR